MASINTNNKINNLAYVGDEDTETEPRKFIRNRNYPKKDIRLSKDAKSHKQVHQKRVAMRVQERIAKHKAEKLEAVKRELKDEVEGDTIVYRVPEPKKLKVSPALKRQPKHKAQENWNDQWEDTELAETIDLEEAHKEIDREQDEYFCAFQMPGEIEEIELLQYQDALSELQKIIDCFGANAPIEMTWKLQEKIIGYENKQRLKELKKDITVTVAEYEAQKRELNRIWITYKAHRIPRHMFEGEFQYKENKKRLEICQLEPVINEKLWRDLKAKTQQWEDYFDQYYAQQQADMDVYFAELNAETELYRLQDIL